MSPRNFRLAVLFLFIPLVLSCNYRDGVHITTLADTDDSIRRLGVLPFKQITPNISEAKMPSSPLPENGPSNDRYDIVIPLTAVEDVFMEIMKKSDKFILFGPDRTSGVYRSAEASINGSAAEAYKKAGRELGVDGLVVGYVMRYRERQGTRLAVEVPASVAFEIQLVRTRDGQIAWRGIFDKTQTSLMENILQYSSFFKRGIRWQTARELTEEGMSEVLKNFPGME